MIAFSLVSFLLGPILLGLAVLQLAPCLLAWRLGSPDLPAFLYSEALTATCALLLILFKRRDRPPIRVREIFLLTSLSWLLVCAFGAVPFMLSHTVGNVTDAVFESVSGITTTGATVLTGLDTLPKDILLWRSIMQWVGGLGIVAMGAAVLPYLRIGGMRLFLAESSDLSEKTLPHTQRILSRLLLIYTLITLACALGYGLAGMTAFDAINHAMTTVSTGGFSTHDSSLFYFQSPAIELVAMLFMLIAAVPFMLYLPLFTGRVGQVLSDGQVRSMLGAYAAIAALLTISLVASHRDDVLTALREAAFGVISIGTTTGYVSTDYTAWGAFSVVVFFFLTFVGGCTGSTSGGIKIFRFKVAYAMLDETMQRLLHPNAVLSRSVQGRVLSDEIVASVSAFALAFACTVGFIAVLLAAAGNDFVTSFSAAATATANVGPGIGDRIGPTMNFAELSASSKWILGAAMILGRLEIFTLLIVLTPGFWRN